MTKDEEIRELKKLLHEKEISLLETRAGMAMTFIEHFGEKAEEIIKEDLRAGTLEWAQDVAEADKKANRKTDIQGLLDFLWEPLKKEGFEYTYEKNEDTCQMHVTRCPLADIAKELQLEKWGFIFYCMSDKTICEGYNPDMVFTRTKTLMEGDDCCDHCYKLK